MVFTNEKHRSIVSGAITLGVHAGLFLIPLFTLPIAPPGQTITGYVTGLVEIQGGTLNTAKEATAELSMPESPVIKPQPPKVTSNEQPKPAKSDNPPVKTGEKAAPKPPLTNSQDTGTTNAETSGNGNGTSGTGASTPAVPSKPGLGNGQGQVAAGGAPIYPKNAQNEGITGAVTYRVSIDTSGKIFRTEALTSSGDARLDAAALRTIKKWSFRSAEENYYIIVQFIFSPEGVRVSHLSAGWAGGTAE